MYRVMVADPPWRHKDKLPGKRGAAAHYSTLSLREIEQFQLPAMGRPSVLFLWRLASLPNEALSVARAWGFTPKTEVTWVKTRDCKACAGAEPSFRASCVYCQGRGWRLHNGLGHHVRGAHETCLVCTTGAGLSKLRLNKDVPSVFFADPPKINGETKDGKPLQRVRHSAKPDEFYELVERLYPGPRVELFARNHRPGWTCFGDEL